MAKSESYVVGIDIGTSRICCVVGEVKEDGAVHIVGLGESVSRGLRKGIVVNVDTTVEAVKAAVEEAELMSGLNVESATVGIAGSHIRSFNSRGVVAVAGKDRVVTEDEVRRVMEAARAVSIPQDREILHVLPQEFVLDDQNGIANPVGLVGSRLEANVHIVTASTTSVQNLVSCVNRAGIEVRDTVLEQLAVAESVLSEDERELGVAMIDIGGGTTDLAIFEKGSLWHTAVLPVGGDHFTNDLAVGLRTPIPDAERLKRKHGCALANMVVENDAIEVPTVGGRKPRLLSLQVMAEILQPRAEEIFSLFREEISRAGFEKLLNAGIVLTGGGSLLNGVTEVAERIFDMPVRHGHPGGAEGLMEPASDPQYATAVGMALYGAKNRRRPGKRLPLQMGHGGLRGVGGRVKAWLSEMF
jgi:cell division protein FtsA